jgi:hypothetical protein
LAASAVYYKRCQVSFVFGGCVVLHMLLAFVPCMAYGVKWKSVSAESLGMVVDKMFDKPNLFFFVKFIVI